MKLNWKSRKHLKPEVILKKLDSIKTIDLTGNVSFSGFEYHNSVAALYSMVSFPRGFTTLQNQGFLNKAISNVSKIGELGKENLLTELKNLYIAEFSKREEKFHLLSSISLTPLFPIKKISIGKSTIRLLSGDFSKKYHGRQNIAEHVNRQHSHLDLIPAQYTKIMISTKAKSEYSAANQCLNDLDLIRAIWSLLSNSGMELIGDEWSPINVIRLGGIHTLHKDSGKIIDSEMYWFEPNFQLAKAFQLPNKDIKLFKKNFTFSFNQLKKCKYSNSLENALVRYVRALDERDQNVALLHIWGALESIIAYEENSKSKLPIRCSFLFEEHEYHRQVLEHLREYRNQSVHSGDKHEQAKSYCYQLQFYFRQVIYFHLHNVDYFNTLEEANKFLDQPVDIEHLKQKRNLIEKAIKFRGGE